MDQSKSLRSASGLDKTNGENSIVPEAGQNGERQQLAQSYKLRKPCKISDFWQFQISPSTACHHANPKILRASRKPSLAHRGSSEIQIRDETVPRCRSAPFVAPPPDEAHVDQSLELSVRGN